MLGEKQSVYSFAKNKNIKVKKILAKKNKRFPLKQDMNLKLLRSIIK